MSFKETRREQDRQLLKQRGYTRHPENKHIWIKYVPEQNRWKAIKEKTNQTGYNGIQETPINKAPPIKIKARLHHALNIERA